MGPTNVALVKLYQADQQLRQARTRLDAATKNVRIQERRVRDLTERHGASQQRLKEQQARSAQLDLDIASHDAQIEKLRAQQQAAKNNKEYQAFLIEINTRKVDKSKIEEEALQLMEANERGLKEVADLATQLEGEKTRLATLKDQIGDKIAALQAEIDALLPARTDAVAAVPRKAVETFDRLADHHDGEALASITKPDPRREEYVCGGCNIDLVVDVYNKLHTRDEMIFCPSCRRILYIPEDLPPETAVHRKKEKREPRSKDTPSAGSARQLSAADVRNSVQVEEEESSAPEA